MNRGFSLTCVALIIADQRRSAFREAAQISG